MLFLNILFPVTRKAVFWGAVILSLLLSIESVSMATDIRPAPVRMSTLSDSLFQFIDSDTEPGCAFIILQEGSPKHTLTRGQANLDHLVPITDSTSFFFGTLSKEITAIAVRTLFLQNNLRLDAPVSDFLEDWPEWARRVSVNDLLNQTCGIPDIFELMSIFRVSINDVLDTKAYYQLLLKSESLVHPAGTTFLDTNGGYIVLAHLVETISGKTFAEFTRNEVLKPAGMNSSRFHDDRYRIIPQRAISYSAKEGVGETPFVQTYPGNFQGVGPVGFYSTLRDWVRWEKYIRNLSFANDSSVSISQVRLQDASGNRSFSNGLYIHDFHGIPVESGGGTFKGFSQHLMRFPNENVTILTLCNRDDAQPDDINKQIARHLFEDNIKAFLIPYTGTYYSDELDSSIEIIIRDGELYVDKSHTPTGALTQENGDLWKNGSFEFLFQRNELGNISGLTVNVHRLRNMNFIKK
ncbi:serine hydrolase domain-containing protein [Balneolaceae bacterium ANBcel3]|nr:serine hydrolase domain-containing protein [Balneolaceae bacterium ANBcel3]